MMYTEVTPICSLETCKRPLCSIKMECQKPVPRHKVCTETHDEHDAGPWTVSQDGRTLSDNDFTHDAVLRVDGDFATEEERKQYAHKIADRLNGKCT